MSQGGAGYPVPVAWLARGAAEASLARFRAELHASRGVEASDDAEVMAWLDEQRAAQRARAEVIPLREVSGWKVEAATGNVRRDDGAFFAVQGLRVSDATGREKSDWEQAIITQDKGGILGFVAHRHAGVMRFLLQAKYEPGNHHGTQLAPTLQATMSNLERDHGGERPLFAEYFTGEREATLVYCTLQNEEAGRFYRKTNCNVVVWVEGEDALLEGAPPQFMWATLSQIRNLCLRDYTANPFVRTVLAPF